MAQRLPRRVGVRRTTLDRIEGAPRTSSGECAQIGQSRRLACWNALAKSAREGRAVVEAQRLSNDPMLLEIPAKTEDEPRFLVIGEIEGRHWSAVITYRGSHVRSVSVRRARTEEVAFYES